MIPLMRRGRTQRAWWIGVDLGGTWIRVSARDARDRQRVFKGRSPGLSGLPALLRRRWRRWSFQGDDVQALVVASRGVWTAAERRRQARRLRGLARRVRVISDAEAAYLGALGAGPGVLLLAGTGSMALGRDARGRGARAGGWGPLLGDEGSAFWIGREWLRAAMHGRGFGRTRGILRAPDPVARVAALAPGVCRRAREGSRQARRIVVQSQAALAALVVNAARELRLPSPVRVSWAGGLLDDPAFRAGVWRAAREDGLCVEPAPPRESASAAVVRLAGRLGAPRSPRRRRPRESSREPLQADPRRTPPRSRHTQ
jgi:N-acetylglucosamine kinase-like BadF-type ATPase